VRHERNDMEPRLPRRTAATRAGTKAFALSAAGFAGLIA
jgi:hypothetical protein